MTTFIHPFGIGTHILEIKDPEFGDTDEIALNTGYATARDGSLWSKKSPSTKKFKLQFIELDRKKALELRDFLGFTKDNLAIRYIDFSGVSWAGRFIDESFEIETPSRGPGGPSFRNEANQVTLTFEGIRA